MAIREIASEAAVVTNPKGIFDRSTRGLSLAPVTVQIERGRIRFFSQTLGETDSIHFDVAAARARGFPDVVAPPTFFMAIEAEANEERKRAGQSGIAELVRCDYRYLLHGDEQYTYESPIFAGDEVSFTTTVTDFYDKKGGAMEFVTFESVVQHAERGVLMRARRNLLHRLG